MTARRLMNPRQLLPLLLLWIFVGLRGAAASSFITEEVRLERTAPGAGLTGTLTCPTGDGPFPAVVLISGLGPGDVGLVEYLAHRGIAVLKFDDRVVSESDGNPGYWTPEAFTDDALRGVRWLKGRREIDAQHVGLIGHSQGGLAAAMAAVRQSDQIAFVVLLAAIGVPVREWQVRQLVDQARAGGIDAHELAVMARFEREKIAGVLRAKDAGEIRKLVPELAARVFAGFTPEQRDKIGLTAAAIEGMAIEAASPWYREFVAYDPWPIYRRLRCPVLALHGSADLQVAARPNLRSLAAALRAGGNWRFQTRELPGLDHSFQTKVNPVRNAPPAGPGRFDATALQTISQWVQKQTSP